MLKMLKWNYLKSGNIRFGISLLLIAHSHTILATHKNSSFKDEFIYGDSYASSNNKNSSPVINFGWTVNY